MNLLRLRPTTIIAALLLSQGLSATLVDASGPAGKALAFGLKKKTGGAGESADKAAADKDTADKDKEGAKIQAAEGSDKAASKEKTAGGKEKAARGAKSGETEGKAAKDDAKAAKDEGKAARDEPKERKLSKEEQKEEDELEAEFAVYQKQLKDLLKTVKTPFGSGAQEEEQVQESELSPMSIAGANRGAAGQSGHLSLGQRLLQCKVYMPGHMMIGRSAEFTVKGRPGYWAALAMADKDHGAKPIYGQAIRLGPDRKVVALGKIPASGVLSLKMFAPVAGDLVGGKLYFEAALWPEDHPERLELAQPVSSETQMASNANSVGLVEQSGRKHGVKFVPDSRSPYSRINGPGLGNGSPI